MTNDFNQVSANPAKSFFVSNLIKDITLRDAIGDLVDNAVDAVKAKATNPNNLIDFEINIQLDENSFSISDNGFGMEASIARDTAFNFGKAESHKLIDNSIGQFGIGMKRAFFKIGKEITVKSVASSSEFSLVIDVDRWLKEDSWTFHFTKGTLKENTTNPFNETGLNVEIKSLSNDATLSFSDRDFITKLENEIKLEQLLNINKGLTIKINNLKLNPTDIGLVHDSNFKPTYWEKIEEKKSVKIVAGFAEKEKRGQNGGWYIFCNDRLILAHDQSAQTGWGEGFAKYHGQYHQFRGFVFFEAKESFNLPWNTTKNGMDLDSPYYKEVKTMMITLTKQVLAMLDQIKVENEKDNPEDNKKLNIAVRKSVETSIRPILEIITEKVELKTKFEYPKQLFNPPNNSNTEKISYVVSKDNFIKVSEKLETTISKEVGLKTFEYFLKNNF